jgi:Rps23 Pro-64 3,4-dihydroxylase Tpa1-like proline 4-hydroxylase
MSQTHSGDITDARCPHLVVSGVLGAETVSGLLEMVAEREDEFHPARAHDRAAHESRVDPKRLDCLMLGDLGPFQAQVAERFAAVAGDALDALKVDVDAVEPRELQISSYGDGGHFHAHIDTLENRERVRVLSCVYYFTSEPRSFGGGELRLYGFPRRGDDGRATVASVDVPPATDTLVAFPSWMRHEVLPVRLDSAAWLDRRFAINCWLHRA